MKEAVFLGEDMKEYVQFKEGNMCIHYELPKRQQIHFIKHKIFEDDPDFYFTEHVDEEMLSITRLMAQDKLFPHSLNTNQ